MIHQFYYTDYTFHVMMVQHVGNSRPPWQSMHAQSSHANKSGGKVVKVEGGREDRGREWTPEGEGDREEKGEWYR